MNTASEITVKAYSISAKTFRTWLKPYAEEIGESKAAALPHCR